MTVLIAHPSADLYGASRMMLEAVSAFAVRGWRVVVTVPERGPLIAAAEQRGAEVRVCRSPVVQKRHLGVLGLARLAYATARSMREGMQLIREVRPEVMYVSTLVVPLWLVLARARRIPSVCHVHEGESSARRFVRRASALPLVLAQRVITNSRFSAWVLTDAMPRLAERCQVVHNGVSGPSAITAPRSALEAPVRLLFVGRLSERKGVQDAVDAIAELHARGVEAELDVVGSAFPGSEWIEDDLQARAHRGGVSERIHLRGFVPDVWPCLAGADVLLVPARVDEAFGNTAVEGALAARPLVVSQTSGLLEATADLRAAVLVPPAQPDAIASAIEEIMADWQAIRAAALDDAVHVASRCSPLRFRAEIANVIEAVSPVRTG